MVANENLQIGMNGRFFPANWRPPREEIAFAHQAGFAALQFPGKAEGLRAVHLDDELTTVRQLLQTAGLMAVMEMVIHVDRHGLTATGQTPLAVLQANLPAITTLPCTCVHWHLVLSETIDEAAVRRLEGGLIPQFTEGVALGTQHGFRFGFEHNEPELLLFGSPSACAALLAAVPGLHFVWDFNHTTPQDLPAFLALIPRMSMLHVSDTPLPKVNHHLPLGMGTIDFAAYCQALRAGGFHGPAILEIGGLSKSGGYGRDTDAALQDSRQRLQQAAALNHTDELSDK
jgi:sugar phosphate isomerase/epimerase